METKICVKCNKELEVSCFNKQKGCKYGVTNICKTCAKEITKKWRKEKAENDPDYAKNKKKYFKEYRETHKQELYETGKKYREKLGDILSEKKRDYYNKNIKKIKESRRIYRINNKEKISEKDRKYYSENKEKYSQKGKEYYFKNKEVILERNAKYQKQYNTSEHGKLVKLIQLHKRRSLINKLPINFTKKDWEECKDYFKDAQGVLHCAYCNKPIKRATQEHFIPVSKGGGYTKDNILPICLKCNSSKNNRDFKEWYIKQEFYSNENEEKIYKYLKSRRELYENRNIK